MATPAVYLPGNVGLWVVNPDNLPGRLARIASFAGGMFTDVFLPRTATPADMSLVRSTVRPDGSKLRAQLWTIPGGLSAAQYAAQVLGDIQRLNPGVVELDIEEPDAVMHDYITDTVKAIRTVRPNYRLRVNVAPYKGYVIPGALFQTDANLYACEQTYYGDMSRVSEAEALDDLLGWGVPREKAFVCYGAAALVPDWDMPHARVRVVGLGTIWTWSNGAQVGKLKRGLVFQDDLLADVGLL